MALFLSTVVNKLDRKGRVSVPAAYRNALAGQSFLGIVALPSFKFPALQCAGMDWMEGLSGRIDALDLYSDAHDDFTASLFADAHSLPFDGDGRIVLPEPLVAHAKLTDSAAFVGRGPTFEIWQPQAFERYKAEARRRAAEKGMTLGRADRPEGA
ncbi:MAG: division/cell wall cluster transcriptional repressor MraZ [Alphaproteobacteria bacterium]